MSLDILIPGMLQAPKPFRQGPVQPSAALQTAGSGSLQPLGAQSVSMTVASTTYLSVTGTGMIQWLEIVLPAATESWVVTVDGQTWDSRTFAASAASYLLVGSRAVSTTSNGVLLPAIAFPAVRFLSSFSVATGTTWSGTGTLYYLYTLDF